MTPRILEPQCEWRAADVVDESVWTERLADADIAELEAAMAHARSVSDDMLEIGKADFPLPTLGPRLKAMERELMDGRGFVRIRGLPRERWSNDDMCLAYWGVGAHLGTPWAQNHYGHLLGDVTDQGKAPGDPTARGNELGGVGQEFHCDGADVIGLMCLANGSRVGSRASAIRCRCTTNWCASGRTWPRSSTSPSPTTCAANRPKGARPGTRFRCSPSTAGGCSPV